MTELIAVEDPPGPGFVAQLERCWAHGDAVLPVDPRLPAPAREALYASLRPTLVDRDGTQTRRPDGLPPHPGDAIVLATSGTTGAPKGVVLTHAAIEASAESTSSRLGIDPSSDTWLCCLPVAHAGGLGVVTRARKTATPLEVFNGFDAPTIDAAARRLREAHRRPLVSLVATALRRVDPGLFGVILLGGDAPPDWGSNGRPEAVVVTYGMTETGGGCAYDGVPLDGVEIRVDDRGQISVRGPVLGRAYRDHAGEHPLSQDDGWFATGDGGRWDDDRLVVEGRLADVIVTGGEKVWPKPVEDVLRTCAGVTAVAVVGRADPEWGQRVVAVVVAEGTPPTLASLRDAVKAVLPPWAAPTGLELVRSLPTTDLGKIRRSAL